MSLLKLPLFHLVRTAQVILGVVKLPSHVLLLGRGVRLLDWEILLLHGVLDWTPDVGRVLALLHVFAGGSSMLVLLDG